MIESGTFNIIKGNTEQLSHDETLMLIREYQNGDKSVLDKLIRGNIGLVGKVASTIFSQRKMRILEFDDLIIEGCLGLKTAVEKFDLTKGLQFSTYAWHWIRQSISRLCETKDNVIYLPAHAQVIEKRGDGDFSKLRTVLSLNVSREDNNNEWINDIPDDFDVTELPLSLPCGFFDILNGQEYEVITKRFGFRGFEPQTLEAIAYNMGVTRERVRQIEDKALTRLGTKYHGSKSKYLHLKTMFNLSTKFSKLTPLGKYFFYSLALENKQRKKPLHDRGA